MELLINELKDQAAREGITIDYETLSANRKVEHIGAYGLKILRIDKSIKDTAEEIEILSKANEEFNNIHNRIREKAKAT